MDTALRGGSLRVCIVAPDAASHHATREALAAHVFPRVREFAARNGVDFSVSDLSERAPSTDAPLWARQRWERAYLAELDGCCGGSSSSSTPAAT